MNERGMHHADSESDSTTLWLDRLVDGELTGDAYRACLKSLDEHPDGWKRCALAFLEAQAWRNDLAGWSGASDERAESRPATQGPAGGDSAGGDSAASAAEVERAVGEERGSSGAVSSESGRPSGGRLDWRIWSALAAGLLAAYGVGVGSSGWWGGGATVAPGPRSVTPMTVTAPAPSPPRLPAGRDEVEFVIAGNDGDWPSAARLPVVTVDRPSSGRRASGDFWSAPEVVELLRQMGREVEHRQEMVPTVLSDGRRVVMPVERVEIKPAKMPAY